MKNFKLSQGISIVMILVLSLVLTGKIIAQTQEEPATPTTIDELRIAIEKVLEETQTPAVGVAMVNQDGPVWIAGLGKANLENNVYANENTMFRIGSVSKMFVALAILKL